MKNKSILFVIITVVIVLILLLIYWDLFGKQKISMDTINQNKKTITYIEDEITYDKNKEGYFSSFYKDGSLKEEGILYGETGESVIYSKDGKIIGTGELDVGKICNIDGCYPYPMIHDGIDVKFYDDESIQSISEIKDLIPLHTTYYSKDGRFMGEIEYKDYGYSGVEFSFYSNGQIEHEYHYKNGNIDGPYYWYRENGLKRQEGFYDNGIIKKHVTYDESGVWGQSNKYDDEGNLTEEHYYKDGILEKIYILSGYTVLKKEYYDKDGNLSSVIER